MKRITLLGYIIGIVAWLACIPIIDRFDPEIEVLTPLQQSYFIQDTIKVVCSFGDNDQLDSAVITIRKIGDVSGGGQIWNPTFNRKLLGRRYDDTLRIVIPATAQLGAYEMNIRLFDFSGNQSAKRLTFTVLGDQRPPVVVDLDLVGLQRDLAGNYLVCRRTVFTLTGLATDNIRIREVKAEIAGIFSLTRLLNNVAVRLDTVFARDLQIPAIIPDDARLLLTITISDQSGNSVARTFNLIVNCDTEAPQIRVQTTAPPINANREARVIEGKDFRILAGTVTDNRRLGRLAITFNPLGSRRDTVFRANLTGSSAQLGALLANRHFQPPAVPGSVHEINIFATDSAGNKSEPFQILLNVLKDEPPQILLTEARINDEIVQLSAGGAPTPIPIGGELRIFGKILEDDRLEYLQIFWGAAQNPELVVDLRGNQLMPLPFDLSDQRSVNRFVVSPQLAATVREIVLQIRAKDTRNPEVVQTYRFVVVR